MTNGPKQLRGHGLFLLTYGTLRAIHTKGLLAGVMHVWTAGLRKCAEKAITAAVFLWKARQFMHWRLSPTIAPERVKARNAICEKCDRLRVRDDGRYPNEPSWYCGSCGCSENAHAELKHSKNHRENHICPALNFPEQAEQKEAAEKQRELMEAAKSKQGGCKGCGGKHPDGNGRSELLEDWHERHGLLPAGYRGRP